MDRLGVQQSFSSFLKTYQITVESARVLQVVFSARTPTQAVRGANAVAAAFLQLRAGMLKEEQAEVATSQEQQVSQAQQKISSLSTQISQLTAEPATAGQHSRLVSLRAQRSDAVNALDSLQQAVTDNKANAQPATQAAVQGSKALDAGAPLPHAGLKSAVIYSIAGIIGGLAVAIGIVLFRAVVSDRVRRRGDVAQALHAPVVVSTGPLRPRLLSPARALPGRATARQADVERIAAQLGRIVRQDDRGAATLAVVAVDNAETAALPVVSLARLWAEQGKRVILADLAAGAPAAKLLGSGSSGVASISMGSSSLVVAVPEPGAVAPQGPLDRRRSSFDQDSAFADAVAAAHRRADVLLTLVNLHPSFAGEQLRSWASDAAVIVTAGHSSWERINAAGELIRLSGTRLVSAVLVGADDIDASLGVPPPRQPDQAGGQSRKAETPKRPEPVANAARPEASTHVHAFDDQRRRDRLPSREAPGV
jgi:capsular polysaccharide biosynthesis protein